MTLRNLDAIMTNAKGTHNKFASGGGNFETMTVSELVRTSLGNGPTAPDGSPAPCPTEDKRVMFNLANKLAVGGDVDIDAKDVALIARCIEHLPPILHGQIEAALNKDLPAT